MKNKNSGLDIDLGNHCSQIAYNWAKKTFNNRPQGSGNPLLSVEGAFSNIMDFNGVKIGMSSDGIGTKIELAERTGIYDTLGFDLVAMVADDLAANGLETVNFSNILDVDHLEADIVDRLMKGLHEAANFARVVITGGEIAELGERIGGYGGRMHFNWGATGVGILPEGQGIIDGGKIRAGDTVIALKSRGFRSNGFSLLRRIMQDAFGDEWHNALYSEKMTWGQVLLAPSLIYAPLIAGLIKQGVVLKGIAHITGGGIGDNLQRVLKVTGNGALLDNLFEPLPVMRKVQELGKVDEAQAYRLWNMGNGMLLVTAPQDVDRFVAVCAENNYKVRVCGKIISEQKIELKTK